MNYNPEIDQYIAKAEDFAKPILTHWRQLIHQNCPDVTESVKWSFPNFEYKDDNMFVLAAYGKHCSFTFMKADLMNDPRLKANKDLKPIQRFLGKVTKLADLPSDEEFTAMLKEAIQLNERGIKIKRERPVSDKPKIL